MPTCPRCSNCSMRAWPTTRGPRRWRWWRRCGRRPPGGTGPPWPGRWANSSPPGWWRWCGPAWRTSTPPTSPNRCTGPTSRRSGRARRSWRRCSGTSVRRGSRRRTSRRCWPGWTCGPSSPPTRRSRPASRFWPTAAVWPRRCRRPKVPGGAAGWRRPSNCCGSPTRSGSSGPPRSTRPGRCCGIWSASGATSSRRSSRTSPAWPAAPAPTCRCRRPPCVSAPGSAATGTATRSSPPRSRSTVLAAQRERAVALLSDAVEDLVEALSVSTRTAAVSPELERNLVADAAVLPDVAAAFGRRNADEPYRFKCSYIRARLANTAARATNGAAHKPGVDYAEAGELIEDLDVMRRSLEANRCEGLAGASLARALRLAQSVGLQLATMDVREHASAHHTALASLYGRLGEDYDLLDRPARTARLASELLGRRPAHQPGRRPRRRRRPDDGGVPDPAPGAGPLRRCGGRELHRVDVPGRRRSPRPGRAGPRGGPRRRALPEWAGSASCRCSRPSTSCAGPERCSTRPCRSRPTGGWWRCGATARRSCSATPTPTSSAESPPRRGRSTAPSGRCATSPPTTACTCGCSTAGAAPSAEAAVPPDGRSSPSPSARSTGRSRSPSRARSSPTSTWCPNWPASTSRWPRRR